MNPERAEPELAARPAPGTDPVSERTGLTELALLFARLGATAFGGPAAHIAMMQDEVVRRRGWLDEQRFLDLLGATNLIPGPNSTEMALHIGWERRRGAGLLVAGIAFIVPAMLITGVIAWAYVRFGTLPEAEALLRGIKPVILAVVAQAIVGLAGKATRTNLLRGLGVLALVLSGVGVGEVAVLLVCGGVAVTDRRARDGAKGGVAQVVPWLPAAGATAATAAGAVHLPTLFWVFFKTGSVLFGSGYVLLAFLRTDLVERLHWLTEAQLLDAITVGQITPGPVFTTATFIGYVLGGTNGALLATLGIFLPAFVFVALSGPLVPRLRASPSASAFLDGVNVASLALMVMVTLQLARSAIVDGWTALLAAVAAVLLIRFEVNSTWLVLGGAVAGLVLRAAGA